MKIVHLIPHFLPSNHFGGTPISCLNLAKAQVKDGHDVTIITTDVFDIKKRYFKNNEVMNGIRIIRLRTISNYLAYKYHFAIFFELIKFKECIQDHDVIHLHEYRTLLNYFASLFKKRDQIMVLNPRGTFTNYNTNTTLKRYFDLFFSRKIIKAVDGVVALSKYEASEIIRTKKISKKIISIIPNGISISQRQMSKIYKKSNYILYIGRIDKRKNIDKLIKAYRKTKLFKKGFMLYIVGSDHGYLKSIKEQIRSYRLNKYIKIFDAMGESKFDLLGEAQLTFYATECEAFGNVPLESVAMGTPVIVNNKSGSTEYLDNRYSIKIFPVNNDNITSALNKKILYPNIDYRKKLLTKLSWSKISRNFNVIYINLMRQKV